MTPRVLSASLVLAGTTALLATTPPEPPRLNVQRDGQTVVLTWTGGGLLESAPHLAGPWTSLPAATSPHRLAQPAGSQFFRLQQVHTLSVTRTGNGTGSVCSNPTGILCGDDCSEAFPAGRTVTLQATPDAGATFAGWSGDCTGTGECVVTLDRARSVTATFTVTAATNPFVNGDFEQGPTVGWAQYPGQVIFPAGNLGGAPPYSGQYAAYLGFDQDSRRIAQLGQRVTLPARQPLYLNFAAWLYSEELCDVPWYDRITLYLNGQIAFQNDRVCRGSGTDGWLRYSVDVSPLAGQSVDVVFEMYSADALASVLLLDDIAIADQAWGL